MQEQSYIILLLIMIFCRKCSCYEKCLCIALIAYKQTVSAISVPTELFLSTLFMLLGLCHEERQVYDIRQVR